MSSKDRYRTRDFVESMKHNGFWLLVTICGVFVILGAAYLDLSSVDNYDRSFYATLWGTNIQEGKDSNAVSAADIVLKLVGQEENTQDTLKNIAAVLDRDYRREEEGNERTENDLQIYLQLLNLDNNGQSRIDLDKLLTARDHSSRLTQLFQDSSMFVKIESSIKREGSAKTYIEQKPSFSFSAIDTKLSILILLVCWVLITFTVVVFNYYKYGPKRFMEIDWSVSGMKTITIIALPGMIILGLLKTFYWLFFSNEKLGIAKSAKEARKQKKTQKEEAKKDRERPTSPADLFS